MINTLLQFGDWLKTFGQTITSILKVIVLTRRPISLPLATQKHCSLLGNGPSLKQTLEEDLLFLEQTELVCVNNFAASPFFQQLKPQNYVIHDPAFYLYDGVTFKRPDIEDTLLKLRDKTDWKINLYVQQRAKKSTFLQNLPKVNPNIQLIYYNYTIFYGFEKIKHWFFKQNWAMQQAQNVLVVALYLALNRQFEQIFLFGADHSWHEQFKVGDNGLEFKDVHFYDTKEVGFIPIYDVEKKETSSMSKQFASLSKAFAGYEVLKKYADYQKVSVLNASKKSYLDAFRRVKI